MSKSSVKNIKVQKWTAANTISTDDLVVVEEPLEIILTYTVDGSFIQQSISVTMRTPGHDFELASGFLFTEGIIQNKTDIQHIRYCHSYRHSELENKVKVELNKDTAIDLSKLHRNFYITSSCGVCGKSSIESIRTITNPVQNSTAWKVNSKVLTTIQETMANNQVVFNRTGGLHASSLFDADGNLLITREDVGRHNALDKLIGSQFLQDKLPLSNQILLLSGRASFELIQKAVMSGIEIVVSIGAPSSLAVDLANEFGMTLIGFLRKDSFNIYSCEQRIVSD